MSRAQFWILNVSAIVLATVLWTHFLAVYNNAKLSGEFSRSQQGLANARQLEPILDQLAKRIAKASDTDPRFRALLVKHGLNVTLEVDGKKKQYP